MTRQAMTARTASSSGKIHSSRVRSVLALCSMSPVGAAATTAYSRPVGTAAPAGTATTCSRPERPERLPGTITCSPARARRSSSGVTSGGQPVGRRRPGHHASLGIEDLDDLGPRDRHRVGHAARVDEQGHLLGAGPGRALDGAAERGGEDRVEHETTDEEGTGEAGDADEQQPGPDAQPGEPVPHREPPVSGPVGPVGVSRHGAIR